MTYHTYLQQAFQRLNSKPIYPYRYLKILAIIIVLIYSSYSFHDAHAENFNVGMYGIWACENKDQTFKLLKNNGFNIASGIGGATDLDTAHKYNIQCLVGTNTQLTEDIANNPILWKKYLEEITQQVKMLKNHPAVFAWYFLDEPSWKRIPISKIEDMNRMIRSIDPKHPIYTVLSTPKSWHPFLPLFDIVAVDPYLRANKNTSDGQPEIVRNWIQKIKNDVSALSKNKPEVWAVLGAFDSKPKSFLVKSAFRKPEPNEFEKMVELAKSEKVGGIMIYSLAFKDSTDYADWYLPSDDPKLWNVVRMTPSKF